MLLARNCAGIEKAMGKQRRTFGSTRRYGIGEWFGRSFVRLTPSERATLAEEALKRKTDLSCPWRSGAEKTVPCNKKGGVCTIRLYQREEHTDAASTVAGALGGLCTVCPSRFYENGMIFQWIGEGILGHAQPKVLREIRFLERDRATEVESSRERPREAVGKIDHVLVWSAQDQLSWCALEMQAVYFSGDSMSEEFQALALRTPKETVVPFPVGDRRPDFRSSGPKRLMPQLQIKVPALRRWGKKMAVVVDSAFFDALGKMADVPDLSNCDIAWFVVGYDETHGEAKIARRCVRRTTLECAVEGLTAGKPVTLETFERRIREKLENLH